MALAPRTGTLKARILSYLEDHPEGATDNELEWALNVSHHAAVNIACRSLEVQGLLERDDSQRPIVNTLTLDYAAERFEITGGGDEEVGGLVSDQTVRTGTRAAQILDLLDSNPEGLADGEIARLLGGVNHAAINMTCHQLEARGLVVRMRGDYPIRNLLAEGVTLDTGPRPNRRPPATASQPIPTSATRPWYWEGEVQSSAVQFLVKEGWSIRRVANTVTRETGRDIEASKGEDRLWVTVKGYPEGTDRTAPSTQAGHWFKDALFDVVQWREQDPDLKIWVVLPDMQRYRNLPARTTWFRKTAEFSYLWVTQTDALVE